MTTTNVTLQVGQTARGVVQPTQDGSPVAWPGGLPVWTVDNPAVVSIKPDPSGMQCDITGMQPGMATVTAKATFISQGGSGPQTAPITLDSSVVVTVTSPHPTPDSLAISANIKPLPPSPSQP
jgi:hypothetical protein